MNELSALERTVERTKEENAAKLQEEYEKMLETMRRLEDLRIHFRGKQTLSSYRKSRRIGESKRENNIGATPENV